MKTINQKKQMISFFRLSVIFLMTFVFFSGIIIAQEHNNYYLANKYLSEKGEVYFKFNISSKNEVNKLTKLISISNIKGNEVFAYANKKEFTKFIAYDYDFKVLPHPGDVLLNPKMFDIYDKNTLAWEAYPTYQAYETMMYQFESDYPGLCKIIEIGASVEGRKLLFAKISDNVNTNEAEPRFMFISTMHGNETTGYVLMLRLIDYLLSNYGTSSEVTNLVSNMEIWINPLLNPDGTYAGGDNTVSGATRENANYVDLNRNYPNPAAGNHPDGEAWQPETNAMMNLYDSIHFVITVNFHGGAELVNYPWDTWTSAENIHADDAWWQYVSREYADTVHIYGPANYFGDMDNGVTNGGDWYIVYGSRQDYTTYFKHGRECTIEISAEGTPQPADLLLFWDYNYRSFLNYIEQTLYGVRGIVTDSLTGEPLKANVFILNHDYDSSDVYTELPFGIYFRPVKQEIYSIKYDAHGYKAKTISNIAINDQSSVIVDVQLVPGLPIANFSADDSIFCSAPATVHFINQSNDAASYLWNFGDGTTSTEINPVHIYSDTGNYSVTLVAYGVNPGTDTLVKPAFISISLTNPCVYYLPQAGNDTYTDCSGTLYDSGGELNYQDNTDGTVTIIPSDAASVTLTFISFNYEDGYDFLRIYDGPDVNSPLIGNYTGSSLPGGGVITTTSNTVTIEQITDQAVTASGFILNWTCNYPTSAPVSAFEADNTTSCTGIIHFNDLSSNYPSSWLWNFGDGTTSNLRNPTHTYSENGIFTVSLTTSNIIGSDTYTISDYIVINKPPAPTVTSASRCNQESVSLTAYGTGILAWYSDEFGGMLLDTGAIFNTPVLSQTTTYYVESQITQPSQYVGEIYNASNGSVNTGIYEHYLIFDCYSPTTLISVFVYAQTAGNRQIELRNSANEVLQSATVNVPAEESRITLNFALPVESGLRLVGTNYPGLFRSNSNVNYPYEIPGLISIKMSSATTNPYGYYYFFYDWEVSSPSCISTRAPVVATVYFSAPVANFNYINDDGTVTFTNLSTDAESYFWTFSDGFSDNSVNPIHTYTAAGNYTAQLIAYNACGSDTLLNDIITGITANHTLQNCSLYPNPASGIFYIEFDIQKKQNFYDVYLSLNDITGRCVYGQCFYNRYGKFREPIKILHIQQGIYFLKLQIGEQRYIMKILIQ
ncbi:MAG: PKD domain-containing protein [Bacteroidia bacterium]|nr:PKD domain-containing protein [Bacteroidia bacterium]